MKLRRVFSLFSLLGLVVSIIIHLISWTGYNINTPVIWFLHIGAVLVIIFVLFGSLNYLRAPILERSYFFDLIVKVLPKKIRLLTLFLSFFIIINLLMLASMESDGTPAYINNKYVIYQKEAAQNVKIKEISEEEFNRLSAIKLKGAAVFWISAYYISFLNFWYLKK